MPDLTGWGVRICVSNFSGDAAAAAASDLHDAAAAASAADADHIWRTTTLKQKAGYTGEGKIEVTQNLGPHSRSTELDSVLLSTCLRTWGDFPCIFYLFKATFHHLRIFLDFLT